ELAKRLQSTQLELADIADEIERINNSVNYSAERIQLVNDRISMGYKLQKKHGVTTTKELLVLKDELQQKLNEILNIGEAIQQKEKQTAELLKQCEAKAKTISANRKKAIKPFAENVNVLLARVGMPNARFAAEAQTLDTLSELGIDRIEFLFDANKSNRFEPLRKVASGGELSRLMLCIKSLVAKKLQLPTLIFDEIDSGISGEAARQVGNIMKELSASHQLISITHQPQIAAKADAHYFVYKAIEKDKIVTSIRLLGNDERITTIAQMLSGEKPTAAALQNAKEMVGN
ncbi:MAG: DNA repair protein RecN, partial [Ferruginibacter sp.]